MNIERARVIARTTGISVREARQRLEAIEKDPELLAAFEEVEARSQAYVVTNAQRGEDGTIAVSVAPLVAGSAGDVSIIAPGGREKMRRAVALLELEQVFGTPRTVLPFLRVAR
jgi:hypothetical protein